MKLLTFSRAIAALCLLAFASAAAAQVYSGNPTSIPYFLGLQAQPIICVDTSGAYSGCGGGTVSITDGVTGSGSISAAGNIFAVKMDGYSSVGTQITSAGSGNTIMSEVSNDSTNGTDGTWATIVGSVSANAGTVGPSSFLAAGNNYTFSVTAKWFRLRVSAYGSGTVTAVYTLKITQNAPIATLATLSSNPSLNTVATTGGVATVSRIVSAAASTNATSAKPSAGRIFKIDGYNAAAAVRYVKIYNKTSAPTVGTDVPVLTIAVGPSARFEINWGDIGFYLSTGIAYALTTGSADADTGALTAADVVGLNLAYQ